MSGRWPALLCLAAACSLPAGRYPLEALAASEPGTGAARCSARAELDYQPHEGWALILDLQVRAEDGTRPLVDLSRVLLRSDATPWTPCRLPPGEDPALLRFRMEEEEELRLVLRCVELRRPQERLELRVPISGTGGKGYVDFAFSGTDNTGDPEILD
jgi:hypothetical protein